jgi:hypothetical protein
MANLTKEFEDSCTSICFIEDREIREQGEGTVGAGIIGTGFLIRVNADGTALIATAKHVLQDCPPGRWGLIDVCFSYILRSGVPTYAKGILEIIDILPHPTHDVSLIHARPVGMRLLKYHRDGKLVEELRDLGARMSDHSPLPLGADADICAGASVMIIGFGEGTDFVFIDDILGEGSPKALVPLAKHGIISQVIPADARLTEVFLYDVETAQGFSGSPLIRCEAGTARAIGVHTDGMDTRDMGYAHAIRFVRDLIDAFDKRGTR